MRTFFNLMLIGCLLIISQATAQNLIVEYEFDGTLTDRLNGSALSAFGPSNDGNNRNNVQSGFLDDDEGTYWYWLSSLANGGGFRIDVNQNISENYSVGVRFSFNETNPGYRKIIDYQNTTSDNGFYFYDRKLTFYPVAGNGSTTIENNQLVDLVATRSADGTFKAYFVVNGVVQTPPELNVNAGVNGRPIVIGGKPRFGFFFNDNYFSGEATTGGKVYSIKIWDAALSAEQIQQALNPKATVADVHITGALGSPIIPRDVVVTLLEGTISSTIAQNENLNSWITNLPAGLSAKAKNQIASGSASFTMEVYGTPSQVSSALIKITIPSSYISTNINTLVAQNPEAKFGIAPYTVAYNGNSSTGGAPPADNNNYYEGSTVTVLSNSGNLVKTGYTFQGWNTKSDGSGLQYTAGQTFVMSNSNVTLYARWTPAGSTPATVTTQAASSVTETTATLHGNITVLGSPNPTAHGFCWSTDEYPALYNSTSINNGSVSSTGAFTANITGLTSGTIFYLRAYATNTAGTVYGEQVSFTTSPNTWTGNTSTDWNTAANWSSSVPVSTSDVVIPSGATHFPVISQGTGVSCNNLTLITGSTLTVASGGSLITTGTVTGDVTIQRTVTGSTNLQANTYHLVSVPLHPDNNSMSELFLGSYLYGYEPGTNSWTSLGTSTNNSLNETLGYMIYYPEASTTYTFSGQPNTGTFTPTVTYAGNPGDNNFALVPNPYPSNIDWNSPSGWTKTNIGNTIWVYNNGNYATWDGNNSTNGGSRYLATGQAFFVQTTGASPALVMSNGIRTHTSASFLKNTAVHENQIRVKAIANGMQDEVLAGFTGAASSSYNPMEDALKFYGADDAPQLYTLTGGRKVSINQMAALTGSNALPMGFESGFIGDITLHFSQLESFPLNLPIRLEDKITALWVNLRETPQYLFTHNPANPAERFVLHFGSATGMDETEKHNIHTWFTDNALYLSTPEFEGKKARIEVFNASGQLIFHRDITLNTIQHFEVPAKGAVITRITLSNIVLNIKSIVF